MIYTISSDPAGPQKLCRSRKAGPSRRAMEKAVENEVQCNRLWHLATIFSSVVFFHTGTSYLEELLFKSYEYTYASFMVLFMFVFYVILYILVVSIIGQERAGVRLVLTFDRSHHRDVAGVCVLYSISNTVSRIALNYVSIPFGMVFKSCKMVAVMLASGAILGKRYTPYEYLIALGFVVGMVAIAQRNTFPSFDETLHAHKIQAWLAPHARQRAHSCAGVRAVVRAGAGALRQQRLAGGGRGRRLRLGHAHRHCTPGHGALLRLGDSISRPSTSLSLPAAGPRPFSRMAQRPAESVEAGAALSRRPMMAVCSIRCWATCRRRCRSATSSAASWS